RVASSATPFVGFTATLTLTDNHGGSDVRPLAWTVNNASPVSAFSSWSGSEGGSVSLGTATGSTTGLTFSASGLPAGLSINASTGVISGVPGYGIAAQGATASISAAVSVSDSLGLLGTGSASFTVTNTNRLPTIASQSATEGQTFSLDAHGTDNTGTN